MAELNENYKNRNGTTDVLSFNISDELSDICEGEIYVSLSRAKSQSSEYGVSYTEEIIRLVTHGLLHLGGRVHDSEEEYQAMTSDTEKFVSSFFNGVKN